MSSFKIITEALGAGALAFAPKPTEATATAPPPEESTNTTQEQAKIPPASEEKKPITEFVKAIIPPDSAIAESAGKYAEKLDQTITDGTKALTTVAETLAEAVEPTQKFIANSVATGGDSSVEVPTKKEAPNPFITLIGNILPRGDSAEAAIVKPKDYTKAMPYIADDQQKARVVGIVNSANPDNPTENDPNIIRTEQTINGITGTWEVRTCFHKDDEGVMFKVTQYYIDPTSLQSDQIYAIQYVKAVDSHKNPLPNAPLQRMQKSKNKQSEIELLLTPQEKAAAEAEARREQEQVVFDLGLGFQRSWAFWTNRDKWYELNS